MTDPTLELGNWTTSSAGLRDRECRSRALSPPCPPTLHPLPRRTRPWRMWEV